MVSSGEDIGQDSQLVNTHSMNQPKTVEALKAELIAWKEREAAERMEGVRTGRSGSIVWDGCEVRVKSIENAELLYELRLEAERA